MTHNIAIIKMRRNDVDPIVATFSRWNKKREQYVNYFAQQQKGERDVFVAWERQKVVGYGTLVWNTKYEPMRKRGVPEIVDLNVINEYQRKGIGTALIEHAEELASRKGRERIGIAVSMDVHYAAAQSLYPKLGFIPDGTGICEDNELHFEKELASSAVKDLTEDVLQWCNSVVGNCRIASGNMRFHGRTAVSKLQTDTGSCFVKIHKQRETWEREVHGYEQWASAFGSATPKLLAVREHVPLALLVNELPGEVVEKATFSPSQEKKIWHDAGRSLAVLHESSVGTFFGWCRRSGEPEGRPVYDAVEYISSELEGLMGCCTKAGSLSDREKSTIRKAEDFVHFFEGERPVPCHRDFCPANWLATENGEWTGVIDFEFSRWDVRVTDFSRYPGWEWMTRPDLCKSFFEGYGRPLTDREEKQIVVAHVLYAMGAIAWGRSHSYFGFEREGHQALEHIRGLVGR